MSEMTFPPLAVTDAALVGSLADGVIIVTRMGTTHKAQLEQCAKLLTQANATLLGVVLNRASLKTMGDVMYGYGYGYGSYGNHEKYHRYYGQEIEVENSETADPTGLDIASTSPRPPLIPLTSTPLRARHSTSPAPRPSTTSTMCCGAGVASHSPLRSPHRPSIRHGDD